MSYTGIKTFPLLVGTVASASPWQALFARSGYRVYPFQLGAKVRGTSTGTAVTLYGQGAVALNDYVIFCDATAYGGANMFIPNLNKIRRVSAVSSSDDAITIDAAVSITAGDYMLVIGADTAVAPETAPNYDGSTISLYSDNAGITALTPKYVATTTGGSYIGWVGAGTKAVDLLITNSSGVPQIVDPFVATLPNEEVNQVRVYTAAGATPSVAGFKVVKIGQSGGVTITNLTGGTTGQQVSLIFTDANTTIADSGNFKLNSAVTSANEMVLTLVYDGTSWYEVSRSTGASASLTGVITETELASGTSTGASIDLTSISQSYDDLILRVLTRSSTAAANDSVAIALNNDTTGTNYYIVQDFTTESSVGSGAVGADSRLIATTPAASGTSGYFGYFELVIPIYTGTNHQKLVCCITNPYRTDATSIAIQTRMVHWENAAAVSRITLTWTSGANFVTGTAYKLSGRKTSA